MYLNKFILFLQSLPFGKNIYPNANKYINFVILLRHIGIFRDLFCNNKLGSSRCFCIFKQPNIIYDY